MVHSPFLHDEEEKLMVLVRGCVRYKTSAKALRPALSSGWAGSWRRSRRWASAWRRRGSDRPAPAVPSRSFSSRSWRKAWQLGAWPGWVGPADPCTVRTQISECPETWSDVQSCTVNRRLVILIYSLFPCQSIKRQIWSWGFLLMRRLRQLFKCSAFNWVLIGISPLLISQYAASSLKVKSLMEHFCWWRESLPIFSF